MPSDYWCARNVLLGLLRVSADKLDPILAQLDPDKTSESGIPLWEISRVRAMFPAEIRACFYDPDADDDDFEFITDDDFLD